MDAERPGVATSPSGAQGRPGHLEPPPSSSLPLAPRSLLPLPQPAFQSFRRKKTPTAHTSRMNSNQQNPKQPPPLRLWEQHTHSPLTPPPVSPWLHSGSQPWPRIQQPLSSCLAAGLLLLTCPKPNQREIPEAVGRHPEMRTWILRAWTVGLRIPA
ncbi:hypothetical protein BS50DRAFT_319874 [Corynespora cassiicola Philippines]|uniref:Uncharacterized protein n=1 Tax=Corynespora cassiicola Philippines TaxID=1448308 RepID=A0A2T2NT52_CORCC|nr:hypothetical protein BS50DRAFT_319874 [Corynespora cassiicola Philippines]